MFLFLFSFSLCEMGIIIVPGSSNDSDNLKEGMDAQRLALTTHSTDRLGLRLVSNSKPSPRQLWESCRLALSAREPGAAALGVNPGHPQGSHRCVCVGALGPGLSIRERAMERAALRDPTQAVRVPRYPTRVHSTPARSGGLCRSAGTFRPKPS